MKRFLLATAAALLISTAAANAYELNCDAPVVAIGDDARDNNPVVGVGIRYIPDDHQWRVFHYLSNGLVVSRSEQYAIQDASTNYKAQWQGSLFRQRNIYMVGEVKRVAEGIVYMEWIYDRNKHNLLVMQSSAHCATVTAAQPTPEMLFMVPPDVSGGHMNVRNGPGANHGLLGMIPAGQTVRASRCVLRDDGIAGADWCLVTWNGLTGWVSQVGLLPIGEPAVSSLPRPTS